MKMLGDPRALFYETELLLPPIAELKISKETVRNLYNKMFEVGGYQYENLELQGNTPTLSTRRGEDGLSKCQFESHSVTIEEKNPDFGSIDEFVNIVSTVLKGVELSAPVFMQRCKIQCVFQAHGSENAIELLAGKVANVWDKIGPFERPPALFGVKFRFPPGSDDEEQEKEEETSESEEVTAKVATNREPIEYRGFVTLRIETYGKDAKQVWMEVSASYPASEPLSIPGDLEVIGNNIKDTYCFLTEKARKFLDQFDCSISEGEGGS
jgi:hypothetical protein